MRIISIAILLSLSVAACQQQADAPVTPPADSKEVESSPTEMSTPAIKTSALMEILDRQPEETQARYAHRNPKETLEFFGIEPGMTIVEALPGGGWYTRILLPYLGGDGKLIGADYSADMWPKFGFFDDKFLEAKETWVADWTAEAENWRDEDSAELAAFVLGALPAEMEGSADAVLLIRALHNLARFESDGGFLTEAIDDVYRVLKPGGVVGIVQHQARGEMPDDWADGSRGYLKRDFVVAHMERAGFEFLGAIEINENERDQPGENDVVWRLPPTLLNSGENPELRAEMQAIGESNRMTLKFLKPAA